MIAVMNNCVHIQIWGWPMSWKHLVGVWLLFPAFGEKGNVKELLIKMAQDTSGLRGDQGHWPPRKLIKRVKAKFIKTVRDLTEGPGLDRFKSRAEHLRERHTTVTLKRVRSRLVPRGVRHYGVSYVALYRPAFGENTQHLQYFSSCYWLCKLFILFISHRWEP